MQPTTDNIGRAVMRKVRLMFDGSGLSADELGRRMGFTFTRPAAHKFLTRTKDPTIGMLNRFAKAIGVPLADLVSFSTEERKDHGLDNRDGESAGD